MLWYLVIMLYVRNFIESIQDAINRNTLNDVGEITIKVLKILLMVGFTIGIGVLRLRMQELYIEMVNQINNGV